MKRSHYMKTESNGEPSVFQTVINGFELSWNPDDNRFHITKQGEKISVATFNRNSGWKNAVNYAKTR